MISDKNYGEIFHRRGYVKIPQLIEPQLIEFLYQYVLNSNKKYIHIIEKVPDFYDKDEHGKLDSQVPGAYIMQNNMTFDTLLVSLKDDIEKLIDKELVPTYSFCRLYKKGDILEKHSDRPSCEISVSLALGYDSPKLWPIFIEGSPVYLDPGELVIYRGCDLKHWRDPFEGNHQAQVFLHYNDINGPYGTRNLYDGRSTLGLPFAGHHPLEYLENMENG